VAGIDAVLIEETGVNFSAVFLLRERVHRQTEQKQEEKPRDGFYHSKNLKLKAKNASGCCRANKLYLLYNKFAANLL
jgi:hypothetical protein